MIPRSLSVFSIALCLAASLAAAETAADPLRIVFIAYQNPDQLVEDVEPVVNYLQDRLGRKVESFVATDYAGVVERGLHVKDRLPIVLQDRVQPSQDGHGKMTSRYLPRTKRSRRTSSAIPQIRLAILLCCAQSTVSQAL